MTTIIATAASDAAIVSFAIYLAIVFLLAWFANRAQSGKSFVSEYFLGSRNIGLWGFALTYAATAASLSQLSISQTHEPAAMTPSVQVLDEPASAAASALMPSRSSCSMLQTASYASCAEEPLRGHGAAE